MKRGRRLCAAVLVTAAFLSLGFAVSAAWIPLKAELAQRLIERSWRQELSGGPALPPWPWADTQAVAELAAPALDVRLLVLAGDSGRNLAFGPTWHDAALNSLDVVISGHRDTHFRFLRDLQVGDRLRLTLRGSSRWYEVNVREVIDSRRQQLLIDPGIDRLSLVTCYPFDSPSPGGPLRYVVTAYPLSRRWPASA